MSLSQGSGGRESWATDPGRLVELLAINRARKATLVLVTHDPDLASIADERIALRDGRVVQRT